MATLKQQAEAALMRAIVRAANGGRSKSCQELSDAPTKVRGDNPEPRSANAVGFVYREPEYTEDE